MGTVKKCFFFFWEKRILANSIAWVLLLLSYFLNHLIYLLYAYLLFELAIALYGGYKKWYDER